MKTKENYAEIGKWAKKDLALIGHMNSRAHNETKMVRKNCFHYLNKMN